MSEAQFELVLPCYNEARNLSLLVERAAAAAREAGRSPENFQLLLVNNGSTDDSGRVLGELGAGPNGKWFRVVNVPVNQGYGFGVRTGLLATQAPWVGWSHADMQCDPADAFRALRLAEEKGGLVKGTRFGRSAQERFVSFVFATLGRILLGLRFNEINAQPKVFPRTLLGELPNPPNTFAFDVYVLYRAQKAGYPIRTIEVAFPPRIHGVSKWAATFAGRYKTILGVIRYMFSLAWREGRA